jgi:hypothetical protein
MQQRLLTLALLAVVGFCSPAPAEARQTAPANESIQIMDADRTRDELRRILEGYPRSVGEILRRDPSLMSRPDYMAAYPAIQAFLTEHPEVQRNVEYYFEGYGTWGRQPFDPELEALGVLLGGMAGFLAVFALIGVFAWLVRAIIQHRRWLEASQVQADVHTKLMDRMTSNEELLAYVQSPAGRRFFEATPVRPEAEAPVNPAPVGSIIWALMAGIVLATVGAGFRLAAIYVSDEAHEPFVVVGVIILALGAGFILAAISAYIVSARLGLFPPRPAQSSESGHA